MEYTEFVKAYYRILISNLNKYSSYLGGINDIEYTLEGIEKYTFKKENHFDALPQYEININAPYEVFEEFLDYYANYLMDLEPLFFGKDGLKIFYDDMLTGYDDDQAGVIMNIYIQAGLESLKELGVID